jgi:hypothetical protein
MELRRGALLGALALAATLGGCVDVRNFAGDWTGRVVSEEAVRQGFAVDTSVDLLTLGSVDLQSVSATVTLSDGRFKGTRLQRVVKFSNDALASLSFDGSPLRSYLLYAPLEGDPNGWPASVVISLFGDDHVEMRVLRGNDLFGVFVVHRKE